MKGAELLRRLHRMARSRGWMLEWRPDRGKGSHGLLVMNGRRTIIPDLKAELKNSYVYPARIVPAEEGGWLIRFRDFSEGHSQAEADQDVIDIAEGCLQACIEGRLEDAMMIPEPSEAKAGEVLVTVPIETATKAALFQTVAASGTSRVALAKAVDLDEKEIRRMLDPRHSSKLPRIEQVLKALGKQLRITLVDVVKPPRAPGAGKPEARQRRAAYRAGRSGKAARKAARKK